MSYLGVVEYVLHRFIGDTHHPSGKPQCGDLHERHQYATVQHTVNIHRSSFPPSAHCLLNLCSLCPDVGNHEGVAVPPEGVPEDVGEPGLPVGDVITPSVPQGYNHLENKANRQQISEDKVNVCVSSMRVFHIVPVQERRETC